MNWPFLVICVFFGITVGVHVSKHGEPRGDKYDCVIAFFSGVFELLLILWAMHWRFGA